MTIDEILDDVIRREGGYTDDPVPTKYGVELATLADWRGVEVTRLDVELLTVAEAREIYRARYVLKPGFDKIDGDELRAFIVDAGVHSGPEQAAKFLQRAVGATPDGVIGPKTIAAIAAAPPLRALANAIAERIEFQGELITRKPEKARFAHGWANRNGEFVRGLGR